MDVQGVSLSIASNMDVQGVSVSTTRSDLASGESGNGINKTADALTSPVQKIRDPVRYHTETLNARKNGNAGGIGLDADAQS